MSKFRVYQKNGGDMLELVRYQRKELPKAVGMEERICSAEKVLKSERRNRKAMGKLADVPIYTIPYSQIKKIAALKKTYMGVVERKKKGYSKGVNKSDRIKGQVCLSHSYNKLTLSCIKVIMDIVYRMW